MRRYRVLLASLAAGAVLSACTAEQAARFDVFATRAEAIAFKAGQLYCAFSRAGAGTLIVAVADAAGVPVIVTGMAREAVAAACRAVDAAAVPVAPPANATPATVPTVAAPIKP